MKALTALMMAVLLLMTNAQSVMASKYPALDYSAFGRIPVLHEGRIKPLESFAAVELRRFSASRYTAMPAVVWLAETLFAPETAILRPVLAVPDKALAERLGLPGRKNRLYSLAELMPALASTQEQAMQLALQERGALTAEQKALVALHENALSFDQLLQAMTLFLPLAGGAPPALAVASEAFGDRPTYLEMRPHERELMTMVAELITSRGENPEEYSDEEANLAALALDYRQRQELGARNILLRVIPAGWDGRDEWLTPWALLQQGQGSPASAGILREWQTMAKAYRSADQAAWLTATIQARAQALSGDAKTHTAKQLYAEHIYNGLNPFRSAIALYLLAALLAGLYFFRGHVFFSRAALAAVAAGALLHGTGIALRVVILDRPPVGSLYESLLFVSLIVVITALAVERHRHDGLALAGGMAAALLTLFVSPLIAPDGDDLEMLVAVLNTGFWLATHVLCITAGYGVCLLTSALAHIALARPEAGATLERPVYVLSLLSLLLTAVGTVLGGIWADQSWGRFWGWDPKENGALLIVLWLVWLHHGRLGGHLSAPAFMAGLSYLSVIVALSWIGVNLLNVGLHSYGFTSGLAVGLALFVTAETVLIGVLWSLAHTRMKKGVR